MKFDRWKIATIILAVVSISLAVVLFQNQSIFGSDQKIAQKAIDYINKNKDTLTGGIEAKLSSVDNEKINLRKITLEISGTKYASYVSTDGKYLFSQEPIDLNKDLLTETVENTGTATDGGFNEAKDTEVCTENEKPIIHFFGSTTCPHCQWEEPILKSVIAEFGDTISYHENIDSDKDQDVFSKYSTGSVPTLVIGCKYYRVGSGEASGEEAEKTALRNVICKVTGNLPASVCGAAE